MPPFSITEARLTALLVESILFGFHLISAAFAIQALITRRAHLPQSQQPKTPCPMFLVTVLLLVNAAFTVTIDFYYNIKAFAHVKNEMESAQVFYNLSGWINICQTMVVTVQSMLGDAVLICRCWIVFGGQWRVIALPLVLWVSGVIMGIRFLSLELTFRYSDTVVYASKLIPFDIAFWCCTIAQNILTTGLLVWRIWTINEETKRCVRGNIDYSFQSDYGTPRYKLISKVIRVLIESGTLYTSVAVCTFLLVLARSNAVYVFAIGEIQVAGIAFNLITIRTTQLSGIPDIIRQSSTLGDSVDEPIQFTVQDRANRF